MYDYDGFALLYIQQKPIQHCKANFLQLKNKYNIKGQNSPNWSMKSIQFDQNPNSLVYVCVCVCVCACVQTDEHLYGSAKGPGNLLKNKSIRHI